MIASRKSNRAQKWVAVGLCAALAVAFAPEVVDAGQRGRGASRSSGGKSSRGASRSSRSGSSVRSAPRASSRSSSRARSSAPARSSAGRRTSKAPSTRQALRGSSRSGSAGRSSLGTSPRVQSPTRSFQRAPKVQSAPAPNRATGPSLAPRTSRAAPVTKFDGRSRDALRGGAFRDSVGRIDNHRGGITGRQGLRDHGSGGHGSGSHANHGPNLDLTFGRIGDHRSGFLHIGGTPGNLHLSGSLYRHPRLYGHGDHHYYGGYGGYPYHYATDHYYHNYHTLGYHNRYYRPYYYGYNYSCVYYNDPVVYRLHTPSVVYVETEPETVYVEREPDVVVEYPDGSSPSSSYRSAAPSASGTTATPPQAGPYEPVSDVAPSAVQDGAAAFAAGNYDKAQRRFIEAVMADERDGYAKLLYGFAAYATGDYEVAGVTLRRALLTSEVLIDQPLDVRTLYANQSDFETHRQALHAHVVAHPDDRQAKFVLAYLHYATGHPELAAIQFGELADSDKNDELAARLHKTAGAVERVTPQ